MSSEVDHATLHFCREARRVRSRFAGQPQRLHAALRTLAAASSPARVAPEIPEEHQEHARLRFVREVLQRMDGRVLRYAMRIDLLTFAGRLGINRFDANMIIAQVQHQTGLRHVHDNRPRRRAAIVKLLPYLIVGTIQVGLICCAWRLFS